MLNKKSLSLLALLFTFFTGPSLVWAQCDGGRIPCSHPCDAHTRPTCKDSKGQGAKPHCVTPQYCRDKQQAVCDPGWSPRGQACSQHERSNRGCQDARGRDGTSICVRFTR